MNNRNLFSVEVRAAIFIAVLFLALSGSLLSGGIHEDGPAFRDPGNEEASRFNTTAKTVLAPAYPYLAEEIVDRFGIRDKPGIGIDIGGGPGDLVLELSRLTPGFSWIDADLNPFFARYLFQGALDRECPGRVSFIQADVHKLPFRSEYADVIVSRGSLQQWGDREKAFAEIYRVLKPGGKAFIGRGFSENMPLEVVKRIREKQGGGPVYNPADTARELEGIMKKLSISNFEIFRPRMDQRQVTYGVWVVFSRPGK